MKKKYYFVFLFLVLVVFLTGCTGIILPSNISSEADNFIGEWEAISPTDFSKVEIYSFGNNLYVHVWKRGNSNHPEDYDFGVQSFKISDSFNGVIKLHWEYFSNTNYDQEMEVLSNGVLKVKSTKNHNDGDYSFSCTDYFYNSKSENSFIPDILEMGLYQEDPEFVNLVYQLNSPEKICQYMDKYFSYKLQHGPHSPYQTYLLKEGDCADHAVFANCIANFHKYKSNYVRLIWTTGDSHAIVVYDMGNHYIYSSVARYFGQSFNSILACVNHCASRFESILSDYEVYDWDYYNYRNNNIVE